MYWWHGAFHEPEADVKLEWPLLKRVFSYFVPYWGLALKYLSKVYNDYWMLDQGFLERERCGDLRDLIARRHSEHAAVTVNSTETVIAAYRRMKLYDVSQVPVMQDGRIVGIVDEEDILLE